MARIDAIARDLQLATAGIAPAQIGAELAKFARAELAKVIGSGEGSPDYDIYVNGNKGASESTVIPPGPIVYDFIWWRDIVAYALQFVIERSPERSGRFRRSWQVMVDGQVVANPKTIMRASVIYIVNTQPYSRKIEVGHMRMRVPHGVVEATRSAVMGIWGNMIRARATQIQLPGGYVLKGHFRKGYRPHARTKLRKDTKAGAIMTYPALKLEMR